jgi:putative ABC transport system permease protein
MRLLRNLLGMVRVVGHRQRSYLGLVLARLAGFVAAIALVVAIPLYADAVGYRVLRTELEPDAEGTRRPPFSYLFSRFTTEGPISLQSYERADRYFTTSGARDLGLPPKEYVRYLTTDKLQLTPAEGSAYEVEEQLEYVSVGFVSGVPDRVELLEGALPEVSRGGEQPFEVMVHQLLADELGLQAGEVYRVAEPGGEGVSVPVRISGVWVPRSPSDEYWLIRPESMQDVLLAPEETVRNRILRPFPDAIYQALWYYVLDGADVRSRHAPGLTARLDATLAHANRFLPETRMRISPREALEQHFTQVRLLTLSLVVFATPILGLIAYFIIMVTGMVVQRQQNEIAVLHSRGASRAEVLGIYLLEGLGLGLVALVLGVLLGRYAATLMGWTRSFLDFVPRGDVPVEFSPEGIQGGVLVVVLTLVASLLPALGAAGLTIVSYKQERARSVRKPLWQRFYLDVVLLALAYLGYRQLAERGTVAFLGASGEASNPYTNPLLILTPALWLLALALLSIRLFPMLMSLVGRAVARLRGVSSLLALRYLTRTPRAYTSPVLLLILTLSLATFTASMARTLDRHLTDQVEYDVGAAMRVADLGESAEESTTRIAPNTSGAGGDEEGEGAGAGADEVAAQPDPNENAPQYLFLPVTEYMKIPGVEDATRVSRSETTVAFGDNASPALLLGIDRLDFPRVAHWRRDYAPASLGALMNALAVRPEAVLISREYQRQTGVRVGQTITLQLRDVGEARDIPFVVGGVVDYFPTLYPEDGPFFIANLDYIFQRQGGEFPYEVWLETSPTASKAAVEEGIRGLDLRSIVSDEAPVRIVAAQDRPERQGLYGLLSVGFLTSALLTGLGFLFYSIVSFQRRYIELGMLRAIGLSVRQMAVLLVWEQALIIGIGIVAGTLLGVGVSRAFIPFLQVRAGEHPQTPPFEVLIAWGQIRLIYLIFAVLLGLALVAVAAFLLRLKVFRAVKLGEAT